VQQSSTTAMPEAMKTLRMNDINYKQKRAFEPGNRFYSSRVLDKPNHENFAGLKPDELDGDLILEPFSRDRPELD